MLKLGFWLRFFALSLLVMVWGLPATAATVFWGGGNGFWDDATRWEDGAVPQSGDTVYVTQGSAGDAGATTVDYRSSTVPQLSKLIVESRGAGPVRLNLGNQGNGGSLDADFLWNDAAIVQDGVDLQAYELYSGSSATYEFKEGSIRSYKQQLYGGADFNQSGGSNNLSGYLLLFSTADSPDGSGKHGDYTLSGGTLTTRYDEWIGRGDGFFRATEAALFTQTGGKNLVGNYLLIGDAQLSKGAYHLSGTGLLQTRISIVGDDGDGEFVQSGGQHQIDEDLIVGLQLGVRGTYTLTAGSVTARTGKVGVSGDATFTQQGGSNQVEVLYLGGGGDRFSTATGEGRYEQSGGTLSAHIEQIGFTSAGIFDQRGGSNIASLFVLGGNASGSGEYLMSGGSLEGSRISVGKNGGRGQFQQSSGEVTASSLWLGELGGTGSYELTGGSLTAIDVQLLSAASSFTFSGGRLSFARTFNGDLVNQGGILAPGNLLPSWVQSNPARVIGNYTQQSVAALQIELGGPTVSGADYDQLFITGDAWLDGLLEVELDLGFDLHVGDRFDILTADNIFGQFSTLSLPDLTVAGMAFAVDYLYDYNAENRDLVRLSVVESSPVPEPSSLLLVGFALVGMLIYRRKISIS